MREQITFGKFQGWTPLELAQAGEAGRGYLSWGAEHLKSPKWRQAFEAALHADVQADPSLMAKAIMKDASDISYDEALELAHGEIEQKEEISAFLQGLEERQAAVVAHWAGIMSVAPEKLRALARRYEWFDLDQLPASNFSSPKMHQDFLQFMAAWMAAYDE